MASIDKRPNGRWRARWREYPGGPQRTKSFARKIDAERHLVDVQHRLLTGAYVDPDASKTTLSEFAELHLSRQPWRPATIDMARQAFAHATGAFGDRPLGSIRAGDVQAFVTGLDLAASTVRLVHQHLAALLDAAVTDGLIARNPARGIKLPARMPSPVLPPTLDQVRALLDVATPWFRPAVILGAGLGLRRAEASGLTVDRVLWLERSVRVDRQWLTRRGETGWHPAKTASSVRTIPAADAVLVELGSYVGRRHDGFVLHRDGDPVGRDLFRYQWLRVTRGAGLGGLRYHDLRHHFASLLISAGCSVKAVQHALGHASAATTLNLYAHLWPGDEDRIRGAVERGWARSAEDQLRTSDTTTGPEPQVRGHK
jgi:integrase